MAAISMVTSYLSRLTSASGTSELAPVNQAAWPVLSIEKYVIVRAHSLADVSTGTSCGYWMSG